MEIDTPAPPAPPAPPDAAVAPVKTIEQLISDHFDFVFSKNSGCKKRTAVDLGVSLKTVYNILRRREATQEIKAVVAGAGAMVGCEPEVVETPKKLWFFECNKCGASGESEDRPGNPCGAQPAEGFEHEGECDGDLTTYQQFTE